MCLLVTRNKPYNKTGYRYKILELDQESGKFYSVYYSYEWVLKKMSAGVIAPYEISPFLFDETEAYKGIHVFNKLKDALIAHQNTYSYEGRNVVLVKVKVTGFLGAGVHHKYAEWANGKTGEVWRDAKIVKILKKKSY